MKNLIDFIKEKCTQEEIQEIVKELVPHDLHSVPRSWEEHAKTITDGYYINVEAEIRAVHYCPETEPADKARNIISSVGLAEAFRAMMQLMLLRQAWVKNWSPQWDDEETNKYCIVFEKDKYDIYTNRCISRPLSFPSMEMARDFITTFQDLLDLAKDLL